MGKHGNNHDEVRVSTPAVVSAFRHDGMPLSWSEVLGGTATSVYSSTDASVDLSVAATGDSIIRATRHRVPAGMGMSVVGKMAAVFGAPVAGVVKRVGLFDASNGIFWEQDGTGSYIVYRSSASGSPVDTRVALANANMDVLNGAGPSGITWDPTELALINIRIDWPGYVKIGLEKDGIVHPVHDFTLAYAQGLHGFTTDAMPLRYEITGSAAASLKQFASSIEVAGAGDFLSSPGQLYTCYNDSGVTVDTTALVPIMSVRAATTFNGNPNQKILVPMKSDILCVGANTEILLAMIYNGTLTGASFGSVFPYSGAEKDVAATAIAGGLPVYSSVDKGHVAGNIRELDGRYPMAYNDITGAGDVLTICGKLLQTGSATCYASLIWKEI